jgi:hypothetical protein
MYSMGHYRLACCLGIVSVSNSKYYDLVSLSRLAVRDLAQSKIQIMLYPTRLYGCLLRGGTEAVRGMVSDLLACWLRSG